jgi:hypothetical protein
MGGYDGVKLLFDLCNFTGGNFYVRGLSLYTSQRLMDHYTGVIEGEPFFLVVPATSNMAAIEAAIPVQMVDMSLEMNCMVS